MKISTRKSFITTCSVCNCELERKGATHLPPKCFECKLKAKKKYTVKRNKDKKNRR